MDLILARKNRALDRRHARGKRAPIQEHRVLAASRTCAEGTIRRHGVQAHRPCTRVHEWGLRARASWRRD
eukprot:1294115-Pyramimonas_sp.AAC.1